MDAEALTRSADSYSFYTPMPVCIQMVASETSLRPGPITKYDTTMYDRRRCCCSSLVATQPRSEGPTISVNIRGMGSTEGPGSMAKRPSFLGSGVLATAVGWFFQGAADGSFTGYRPPQARSVRWKQAP